MNGDQLSLSFESQGAQRTARPLGPFPVEPFGCSVSIPVVSRFVPSGIAWTMVDSRDYGLALSRLWYVDTQGYAICHDKKGAVRVPLHNVILPPPPGFVVDHIHGRKLDHRRSELRHLTPLQNSSNVHRSRVGRSSRYQGVTFHRQLKKWQASAEHHGRCIYAGVFDREEDAAIARDALAARLWPGIAPLNFPDRQVAA